MKQLLLIVCAVLLMGCCSKRPVVDSVNTIDSTRVDRKVVERDTIVATPFYKVRAAIAKNRISEKPVTKKSGNATVSLYAKNDIIYAEAECDSLELQLKLRDSIINIYRDRKTEITQTQEVRYTPWFTKILAWIGGVVLAAGILLLAWKIVKPKFI